MDVSEPFIEASIEEAGEAGVENVDFFATDVQVGDLGGPYDYAFSRMGMMFFANPVQALRNIRGALRPGGRLVAVVWRRKLDNEWLHRAEQVVEQYLEEPEEPEDVRCGPGPFSMANADTVSEQLQIAGFELPTFTRCDLPIKIGDDLDHAVAFNMALGPAAELLRICPADEVDRLRPKVEQEIREVLADYVQADGVVLGPGLHLDRQPRPSPSSRSAATTLRATMAETDPEGGNLSAARRDPGAAEAALGLPLTRMR